ncbi:hypothetical protein GCM10027421_31720 [Microbacterium shaanxiense]
MIDLSLTVTPTHSPRFPFLAPGGWQTLPHPPLEDAGYVCEDFTASGTARVFEGDQRESVGTTAYTTRVLAIRPSHDHEFSGVVHIELINPSSGTDYPMYWPDAGFHLMARGDAYLGVTCKSVTADDLRTEDPERYETLSIPHDSAVWDILGAVAAATHLPAAGGLLPGFRRPERRVATGWSQSGSFLRTYLSERLHEEHTTVLGVGGSEIIDGYLIGVSSGGFGPMGYVEIGRDGEMDLDENFAPTGETVGQLALDDARRIILDPPVPVIEYMSEDEAMQHVWHRRPDGDTHGDAYRCYQVPGRGHETGLLATSARAVEQHLDISDTSLDDHDPLRHPASRWLIAAAVSHLVAWLDGTVPPRAQPLRVRADRGASRDPRGVDYRAVKPVVDADGHAIGGLRYLEIDLPVRRAVPVETGRHIMRVWRSEVLTRQEADRRYGGPEGYRALLRSHAARLVTAGWLLPEHATAAIADAMAAYPHDTD